MGSCYITISYHISCSLILSFLLISSPFHYFLLNLIYYIVEYCISFQWMICVYLSVCLFICMNKFFFSLRFFSLFFFLVFSLFSSSHAHAHACTHTHTYMNVCSFLWLVHTTSKAGKWRIVFEWLHYLIFDLVR